jgi:uncharacterized protein
MDTMWMLKALQGYTIQATREYDESHDWKHHERVVKLVTDIGQSEKVTSRELLMLQAAAWVHDIVDHKYVKDATQALKDIQRYLQYVGFTQAEADRIEVWITHTSYSKEKRQDPDTIKVLTSDPLARILADADRIDAISHEPSPIKGMSTGIYRCYKYTKSRHPGETKAEIIKEVKKHCDEKLLQLYEWIFTKRGKQLAEPGTKAIQTWCTQN